MKNGKRFCLLLLLCAAVLTLLCAAAAAESTDDGFQITDGVLTKYTGPGGDVTIPDGVTEIGSSAFENCKALTSIVIPDSVTKIGKSAFSGCTGLKEVTVPDGVTSIEDYVFYHCEALERVSLPKGIVSIGHSSFEYCLKLTDIQLPSGLKSIDHSAFWACRSLVKLTLPQSLETIGNTSFGKCSAMNPLQVPETLKSIGAIGPEAPRFCCETGTDAAYVISKASTYNYFCEDGLMLRYTFDSKGEPDGGLVLNDYVGAKKEVLIPSDVTSINNEDIFKDRTDLVAIRFQGNTPVSTSYFTGCTAVIQCPAGYSNAVYLLQQQASSQLNIATYTGSTLMCYAGSLTKLKLQNDWIYGIAADAFNGSSSDADSLETIILPAYLQNLLDGTFSDLDNLKEIYFGDQLTQIGEKCFGERTAGELPKLYCTAGTKTARTLSNAGYTFLTPHVHTIVIQPAVEATYTETGKTEGSYCSGCGEVFTAQEDVPALGEKDFTFTTDDTGATVTGYKGESTEVHIPSALGGKPVVAIGANAFNGNETITSVTLPDSVTQLEGFIFSDCSDLQSVILPKTLESLPRSTFSGCQKLTDVTLPAGLKTIESYAFKDCGSLREITLPEGLQSIEMGAFWDCRSLNSVTLPASLEWLQTGAFGGCTGLTDLQDLSGKFLKTIDGIVYSADQTQIVAVLASISGNVEFAEGITEIPMGLFDGNTRITGVVIPEGVTRLDWCSFRNCVNLETVQLPESLTRIEEEVFEGCQNLTGITLPAGLEYIGMEAFAECRRLSSITLPAGLQYNEPMAFRNCNGLTELQDLSGRFYQTVDGMVYSADGSEAVLALATVPENVQIMEGVTSISAYALAGQEKIVSVLLPDSVLEINSTAISENVLIRSSDAAYAHTWAQENGRQWEHAHTIVTLPAVEATYTEPGKTEGSYCSECGEVFAQQEDVPALGEKDFTFTQNSIGATVTGYTGESTEVKIPSVLGGKPVIAVGSRAFANCGTLTSVALPKGVTSIGNYAFYNCTALVDIEISEGVTSIGNSAFYNCTALVDIEIPEGVTSIGNFAFGYCKNLTGIVIPGGVTSIQDYTFYHCASLASIVLPEGMTSIGNNAFDHCIALTSIVLPEGVSSIKYCAFGWCENLISVTLPSTLKSLGESVFRNCGNLTSIEDKSGQFLKTVDGIVYSADGTRIIAALATANGEIRIAEGVTKIPDNLFYGNDQITSAVVPKGVTKIDDYAFYGCTALTSIEIPDGVTYIGIATFRGCTALMGMEIPESVTSIGTEAFWNCSSLTGVAIPKGVTAIQNSAFYGCTALTSIVIPESVTSIRNYAFGFCKSLTGIAIPESVTAIENSAFCGCTALTSVTLPSTLRNIGDDAFPASVIIRSAADAYARTWAQENGRQWEHDVHTIAALPAVEATYTEPGKTEGSYCPECGKVLAEQEDVPALGEKDFTFTTDDTGATITGYTGESTEVKIPSVLGGKPVVAIGDNAFNGNETITSVTMPDSVTTIGQRAFYDCKALKQLTLPENLTDIGAYAFSGCTALQNVTLPGKLATIAERAFDYTALTAIHIPASVTMIGQRALSQNYDLLKITVDETNNVYCAEDNVLYNKEKTMLIRAGSGLSGDWSIPFGVKTVEAMAFWNCWTLETLRIPATVQSIGQIDMLGGCCEKLSAIVVDAANPVYASLDGALCSKDGTVLYYLPENIGTYTVPDSVTRIANGAIQFTTSRQEGLNLTLPESLSMIEDGNFSFIHGVFTFLNPNLKIGSDWFMDCNAEKVVIRGYAGSTAQALAEEKNFAFEDLTISAQFQYTVDDTGTTITGYTGQGGTVEIPSVLGGKPVVAIGDNAFQMPNLEIRTDITAVILPEGLQSIGRSAFWGCAGIASIEIPDSVTEIDVAAFETCMALAQVTLPQNLTQISDSLFHNCPLTEIDLPQCITRIGDYAFRDTGLTAIVIPEGTLSIGKCAFEGCSELSAVTIPASVTEVGECAFANCPKLAPLDEILPEKLTKVIDGVVYNADGTQIIGILPTLSGEVRIADGITVIPQQLFADNTSITSVILPNSIKTIEWRAFSGCTSLAQIEFPEGLLTIGDYAFSSTGLTTVVLPSTLTTFGEGVFDGCTKLANIEDKSGKFLKVVDGIVYNVDGTQIISVLESCTGEVRIAEGVTEIPAWLFNGNSQITSIVIPEGVTKIGNNAFSYCENLTSVTLPSTLTTLGEDVFNGCIKLANLEDKSGKFLKVVDGIVYNVDGTQILSVLESCTGEVHILEGVTEISEDLFRGRTGITSIYLPDSVTAIDAWAFAYCENLKTVELPAGLERLEDYTFWFCESLEQINLPSSLKSIGGCAFLGNALKEIELPEGLNVIGRRAFERNPLTFIRIPASVTQIEEGAFAGCSALKNLQNDSSVVLLQENGVLYNEDGTVLIGRMADMPAEVVLKEGLLSIPMNFFMAENITSIVIPDSVTSVGYSVFRGCRQLTEVRLSECLTVLESGMFDECTQLGELYVPSAVTSIDPTAIPDTTVIRSEPDAYARTWAQENGYVWQCAQHGETVIVEPAVPATRKHTGMTAKIQCSVCGAVISEPEEVPVFDGKVMKLPTALKSVQRETFLNLPAECFVLPDGCLVIGEGAFADCKELKLVEIPSSVVAIAENAFEGCGEGVVIVTPKGSAAERFALAHGITVTSDEP